MQKTEAQMLDEFITDNMIATEEEITLVTCICGYKTETMLDIIYARTGYRSYEQCINDGYTGNSDLNDYYGLNEKEDEE